MPKTKPPQLGRQLGVSGTPGTFIRSLLDGTVYRSDTIAIETYRRMRNDYQIIACLNVIAFTIQKTDWHLEGSTEEVRSKVEKSLKKIWNPLIKSISKSFWAGYSPNAKVFEYDDDLNIINIKKIRDLAPETCRVKVDKYGNFIGFVQYLNGHATPEDIPAKYAFWYPNMMEDGNLYGRSMLKAAYNPWYFSELMHMFANRYYERFGEPSVMGKAPSTATLKDSEGTQADAMDTIQGIVSGLKSHSAFTIPSDTDENGNPLFDVKYLESQMRGVDFNTYLNRLDMEKARAIFIPDLLLGTGRVGSYELGKEHKATFLTGLQAIFDDIGSYVQAHIIDQLVDINWGETTEKPKFIHVPFSKVDEDKLVDTVNGILKANPQLLDIQRLADRLGIPLKDAEAVALQPEKPAQPVAGDTKNKEPETKKPAPKPQPAKMELAPRAQEAILKQVGRVTRYVTNVFQAKSTPEEKLASLQDTKIGYSEFFTAEEYAAKEESTRTYLTNCFTANCSLDETVAGLGAILGAVDRESFVVAKVRELRDTLEALTHD